MAATYGDGDPDLEPELQALHDRAVAAGQEGYLDPQLGLFVMTRLGLARRGSCCGVGCRHCPYPAEQQRSAGRATCRPDNREL